MRSTAPLLVGGRPTMDVAGPLDCSARAMRHGRAMIKGDRDLACYLNRPERVTCPDRRQAHARCPACEHAPFPSAASLRGRAGDLEIGELRDGVGLGP